MRCWGLAPVWTRGRLTSARSVAVIAETEYRAVTVRLFQRRPTAKVSLGGDADAAGDAVRRPGRGGAQAALQRLRRPGPDAPLDPAGRAHAPVARARGGAPPLALGRRVPARGPGRRARAGGPGRRAARHRVRQPRPRRGALRHAHAVGRGAVPRAPGGGPGPPPTPRPLPLRA